MGRDHTIFAQGPGFVKYYRDPNLHPKRRYIGIVFDKSQTLPSPTNAPRRRRLGMIAVPRSDPEAVVVDTARKGHAGNEIGPTDSMVKSGADLPVTQAAVGSGAGFAAATKAELKEARRKKATGRLPVGELGMRPDYSYRESNAEIGRAAERADLKSNLYRKNRFLAWRLRTARKQRAMEKRAMFKKSKTNKGAKRRS